MKIVERQDINTERWNKLVNSTEDVRFFSHAWYLDATAENWCALISEDYTAGIALPYSKRLGVETLYTPIFVRYLEWLGDTSNMNDAEKVIRNRFSNMHVTFRQEILGESSEQYIFQEIDSNEGRVLGSQAKRTLKKAEKFDLTISDSEDYDDIFKVVYSELNDKFSGIDATSLTALKHLFNAASESGVLKSYSVDKSGGIICLEDESHVMYLKGAVLEDVKKNGGMYLALDTAINEALLGQKKFDFGGSRVEGVRRFNQNLGGTDVEYYCYKVDKTPFWFKFARRIRNAWRK